MSRPVFRFAPSPNGRLHLGHAYSALLNEALAREAGGRLLLRLEDIDPVRSTPETVRGVEEDLRWLGIRFDPPVRRQSEHLATYREVADRLRDDSLLYPCFCSRGRIAAAVERREVEVGAGRRGSWPRDPDGTPLYPGTCRSLPAEAVAARIAAGEPHAWRVDGSGLARLVGPLGWRSLDREGRETEVAARPERWGDAVLVRKDVPASYHLCVAVDDALQEVSHAVRGAELEAATDLHVALAAQLGLASPRYHHHALVLGPDGAKLSKSLGSPSLASMRANGATAEEIRRRLGFEPAG